MELILIRHTTPNIEKGICYGQADLGLASSFESELKSIINEVGAYSKVYSSPLKRCDLLANRIGEEVILDDRLMEMNFGDWELEAWNDIPKEEIQPWYDDYVNVRAKNGESLHDLSLRVREFLSDIRSSGEERIVCVTHAGVIRVIYGVMNHIPFKDIFNLKLDFGEVVIIEQ